MAIWVALDSGSDTARGMLRVATIGNRWSLSGRVGSRKFREEILATCGIVWLHVAPMSQASLDDLLRREQRRSRRSVGEIASALGVHRATLSRWMSGARTPTEEVRGLLCRELRCSLATLLRAIEASARGAKEAVSA